jgi:peptide/nickel transport system substrate-binding protein
VKLSATLVLIAALSIVGCSGSSEEDAVTKTSAKVAPPSATANDIHPASRDQLRDGGTLTWPIDLFPPNFNFNQIDGTEQNHYLVNHPLMPRMYLADAAGVPHWNPQFLASEPILTAEPAQVVTYVIHPKAIWTDGSPITWQDFYWQWKALNGTDKAYQIASSNGYADIARVERGRDDREVVVTYSHHYADWQNVFTPLYPASTSKSPQVFNAGWKNQMRATAGPFRLDRIDLTSRTITLVRNEHWWGPTAKLDRIVFRVIDPDAQIDALANGEVDGMDIGPDANKYNRARTIADAEIRAAAGPNFRHLTINGSSTLLQDVTVRQALAKAIDRDALARALLGPLGITPHALNNHIFMANQAGYADNAGDVGKYDPAAAAALLDRAGWTLSGDVRRKDGRPFAITCVIPSGVAPSKQEAELIQNMLARVGVKMAITVVPISDFFDKYITPGQFDVTLFSWIGTVYPISDSKSMYALPKKNALGELAVQQNFARIGSEEIDRLLDQASQELDRPKAIALANRIDTLIWQEVHSLTLYQRPELWAVRKNLANFGAIGFADLSYEDIGWVKR